MNVMEEHHILAKKVSGPSSLSPSHMYTHSCRAGKLTYAKK